MTGLLPLGFAYLLDLLLGDPSWIPHPVKGIGRLITFLEGILRKISSEKIGGTILALTTVTVVYSASEALLWLSGIIHPLLFFLVSTFILYTTFATKDLKDKASLVCDALKRGNIQDSRNSLSMIVGRDTGNLDETQCIRATVESVSENSVDGIISPLFYAFLGGPSLALAFKAISTMDSMIGYKNSAYKKFGWAAARLDDLANFIPARISPFFIMLSVFLLGKDLKGAIKVTLRDRTNSASPNSGIPEACFAGALGIGLGGESFYQGIAVNKPYIGEERVPLSLEKIEESIRVAYLTSLLSFLTFFILKAIFFQNR